MNKFTAQALPCCNGPGFAFILRQERPPVKVEGRCSGWWKGSAPLENQGVHPAQLWIQGDLAALMQYSLPGPEQLAQSHDSDSQRIDRSVALIVPPQRIAQDL